MKIHVGRYDNPQAVQYDGWIEPEDKKWILFVPADGGTPHLFIEVEKRDENGATVREFMSIDEVK